MALCLYMCAKVCAQVCVFLQVYKWVCRCEHSYVCLDSPGVGRMSPNFLHILPRATNIRGHPPVGASPPQLRKGRGSNRGGGGGFLNAPGLASSRAPETAKTKERAPEVLPHPAPGPALVSADSSSHHARACPGLSPDPGSSTALAPHRKGMPWAQPQPPRPLPLHRAEAPPSGSELVPKASQPHYLIREQESATPGLSPQRPPGGAALPRTTGGT